MVGVHLRRIRTLFSSIWGPWLRVRTQIWGKNGVYWEGCWLAWGPDWWLGHQFGPYLDLDIMDLDPIFMNIGVQIHDYGPYFHVKMRVFFMKMRVFHEENRGKIDVLKVWQGSYLAINPCLHSNLKVNLRKWMVGVHLRRIRTLFSSIWGPWLRVRTQIWGKMGCIGRMLASMGTRLMAWSSIWTLFSCT